MFVRDIDYLLRMGNLWKDRRPPEPFRTDDLHCCPEGSNGTQWETNQVWPLPKWLSLFADSLEELTANFKQQQQKGKVLTWDKVSKFLKNLTV